ncbi:mitochondrial respiratory complex I chaperone [Geosmithia morbida]|uniref:Mitochondrial respiratory complex I chaperone n=1 Tax=Geosmithia morbida TaxID=1094350 RepID=A0A9P5D1U3_9HYPO|nr:mitochondrial respiratory complex I chaperone [Geosmithia morbida]KAF4124308.1 mitochondrial respiratory complex I chaperone [Geosmithia morbida]
MRASLARHARHVVVRQAHAPSCASYAATRRRPVLSARQQTTTMGCRMFKRTFLEFLFKKAPREIRQPEYEPGWMQVMVWRSRMLDKLRPPTRKELMTAWRSLMQSKLKSKVPLNSTQALQCRRLLEYLTQPAQQADNQNVKKLSTADLTMARKVLLEIEPYERTKQHLDLARALDAVWQSGEYHGKDKDAQELWSHLVRAMCRYGGAREALAELYAKWDDPSYSRYIATAGDERVLEDVARGLADEGHEKDLVELIERDDVAYTPRLQEIVTTHYARQSRVPETQKWFTKPLAAGLPRPSTYHAVAAFASRNGLVDWVTPFLLELGQAQPRKTYWDALLRSMLLAGIPLDEVRTMMSHMMGQNGPLSPDTATANAMLRAAAELGDRELAEGILSIASEKWIRLDGESYLILLSLHVAAGSVADAKAAFDQMTNVGSLSGDSTTLWAEYDDTMNRYLVLLCRQRPPDFKLLLELLSVVEEERLHLRPETVARLCLRFLENDQFFDVMDILSIHAFTYSEAQRDVVQESFFRFCVDANTSTSRAWGTYQLLQQFFQDLSFDRRVLLLEAFFDRRRPDMATHVFSHMRQHGNVAFQPRLDTYVRCFEGFSRNPDREGTESVHNMLKMDPRVRPDTRLNTALMLAYAACERPLKALDFWSEIKQSPDGPSYASLEAVFWTLERKSGGGTMAREIWDKIEAMDLEVPTQVYTAYMGAIAASANQTEARSLLTKMASYTGSEPDAMALGIVFNALPGDKLQAEFKEWAAKKYRQAWAELQKKRKRRTELGVCQYKLDRVVKA